MTQLTGFIEEGFSTVRDAVVETMDRLSVDFRPVLTQAVARYARRQIKLVETLLRRLLVLLAAELGPPAPVKPSTPDAPTGTGAAAPESKRSLFQLVPSLNPVGSGFDDLRAGAHPATGPDTDAAPLLHRLGLLLQHLDNPVPLARRMARILNRVKAAGDPRPFMMPLQGLARVPHPVALLAQALPVRGNDVLRRWFDTS